MAKVECSICNAPLVSEAVACPVCGYKRPWSPTTFSLIAALFTLPIALYAIVVHLQSQQSETRAEVQYECQKEIQRLLDSLNPISYSNVKVQTAADVYTVSGFVDAQDSRGAVFRTGFTCHYVLESEGDVTLRKVCIDGVASCN